MVDSAGWEVIWESLMLVCSLVVACLTSDNIVFKMHTNYRTKQTRTKLLVGQNFVIFKRFGHLLSSTFVLSDKDIYIYTNKPLSLQQK